VKNFTIRQNFAADGCVFHRELSPDIIFVKMFCVLQSIICFRPVFFCRRPCLGICAPGRDQCRGRCAGVGSRNAAAEAVEPIVAPIAATVFHIGPLPVTTRWFATGLWRFDPGQSSASALDVKRNSDGMTERDRGAMRSMGDLAGGVNRTDPQRRALGFPSRRRFLFCGLSNLVDFVARAWAASVTASAGQGQFVCICG